MRQGPCHRGCGAAACRMPPAPGVPAGRPRPPLTSPNRAHPDTSRPASRLGPRALFLRRNAPREPRARPRLRRRGGAGPRHCRRGLAQPAGHAAAVWRSGSARHAGVRGALPAPHAAHATGGAPPHPPRARHSDAADRPCDRHARRVELLRRVTRVHARGLGAVEFRRRGAPARAARPRLAARLPRSPLRLQPAPGVPGSRSCHSGRWLRPGHSGR